MAQSQGKLIVLYIVAFVDMIGLTLVLPLLPYYATEFGASATMVGILVSAFSVSQMASAPVWGRFSDSHGRRPMLLIGLSVTAVAYVLFGLADSILLLFASRVIQGLGGGTIGVVQAYVADASAPKDRTKALGWLSAVTSLGAVVGPAFGSVMVTIAGQPGPGIGAAALSVLVAVFAWKYLRESQKRPSAQYGVPSETTARGAVGMVLKRWHEPAARLIWIYTIAIGAFYGTVPVMPLLLVDRLGITEQTVGYVVMYLGGMGVLIRSLVLGRMVDWLREAVLSRVGIVLLAIGLALVGVTDSYPVLIVSLTLMPLGTAFIFPCITGLLSRVVAGSERGLYMGVQHMFGGVSRVAFPLGAGIAMDSMGLGFPFVIAGILVLATLPLTQSMALYATEAEDIPPPAATISAADITAEVPIDRASG